MFTNTSFSPCIHRQSIQKGRGSEQASLHAHKRVYGVQRALASTQRRCTCFNYPIPTLCVHFSCSTHFIQAERRSRAGRYTEEHVVLALMPHRQEHRGVHNIKSVVSMTTLHEHHPHTQIKHRTSCLSTTHLTSRIVTNMFCISLTIWLD